MRTVVENRYGISPKSYDHSFEYKHHKVSENTDKKLRFVFVDDAKPSEFIQDLVDKFCK